MKKGFTLIELLVVVLIIGILAAIALPQYQIAVEKSRASQAFIMVKAIKDASDRYQLATGEKPKTFDDLDIGVPGDKYSSSTTEPYEKIKDKNYYYELWDQGPAARKITGELVIAHYENIHSIKNSFACAAATSNATANKICKSFGSSTPNESSASWNYYAVKI
ncbi:PilE-like protein [Elusimicrobium minutum Pei191]|uniref:PilE-like protein n=1 Tax=Elusimicrobium minutum (strain Pei191) TaxID=445932 RepID=B2KAW6_ELUMP|nr:prepilin-type N-terminal cleavage/methylation domain-containing protein [Elusimicrobium minutum]ACC97662.1 PilE-like protein [Elusimicrobium minutum Pei191]